jgi:hypothetical protein
MPENRVVSFQSRRPPTLVVKRFPDHRDVIEVLWKCNEEFREVCADFVTARSSLKHVERSDSAQSAVETYEELLEELHQELLVFLSAPLPIEN